METQRSDYGCLDGDARRGALESAKAGAEDSRVQVLGEVGRRALRPILCAACRFHVTDARRRIVVAGEHRHTFFNPAGLVYRVACFSAAPGCRGVGAFCREFSWFHGYRWQVATCVGCAEHLGWHFEGEGAFAALIESRIVEGSAPAEGD